MKIRKATKKDFIIFGTIFFILSAFGIYGAMNNDIYGDGDENPLKVVELGKCDERGCFIELENGDTGYMLEAKVGKYACKLKGLSETRYYECGK